MKKSEERAREIAREKRRQKRMQRSEEKRIITRLKIILLALIVIMTIYAIAFPDRLIRGDQAAASTASISNNLY